MKLEIRSNGDERHVSLDVDAVLDVMPAARELRLVAQGDDGGTYVLTIEGDDMARCGSQLMLHAIRSGAAREGVMQFMNEIVLAWMDTRGVEFFETMCRVRDGRTYTLRLGVKPEELPK